MPASVNHRQIIIIPHHIIDPEEHLIVLGVVQVDITHRLKDRIRMSCVEQGRGRKKFAVRSIKCKTRRAL